MEKDFRGWERDGVAAGLQTIATLQTTPSASRGTEVSDLPGLQAIAPPPGAPMPDYLFRRPWHTPDPPAFWKWWATESHQRRELGLTAIMWGYKSLSPPVVRTAEARNDQPFVSNYYGVLTVTYLVQACFSDADPGVGWTIWDMFLSRCSVYNGPG
jgi:hypothetical protein